MALMDYGYDEEKSEATLLGRGIDLDFAAQLSDGEFIEYEDQRHDYGERRYGAIGQIGGVVSPWSPRREIADDGFSEAGQQERAEMPTVERSRKRQAQTGRVDWRRVPATTEEEIARQIVEDPETAPELTDEALDRAVVVSPHGRRTPYRERVAGLRGRECLRPGTKAPRSGRYAIMGAGGAGTGIERTVARGDPLPPTPAPGSAIGQRHRKSFAVGREPTEREYALACHTGMATFAEARVSDRA
jgi:uncharacterized DUF497 family protein